jgi:hypothetical protein
MKTTRAAGTPKKLASLHRLITRAYSGRRARSLVAGIYRSDRHITNPQYEKGALFCWRRMKELGLDGVELLKFPIDGKRFYGNWKTPKHWDVRRARLQLKIGGRWRTFADYGRIPTSLFVYSAPTQGEVRTLLVPAECEDLRGKLVFSGDGRADPLHIRKQGARGVVSDFAPNWPGVRTDQDFRDGHRWDNSFLMEDDSGLVGFSLSRNQGVVVRKELEEKGAVECRFKVDGRLGKGDLSCVTGCLRGAEKPDEEVVVVAHLYEAGANDNVSGVAGSIEALHTLQTLIRNGVLKPPARTIRVLFTMEIVGFLAYFTRVARSGRRYVAGVNPDMLGENQKTCRSVLHVYQAPDSVASFADPLLLDFVRRSADPSFKYEPKGFIVNDNMVSDPTIGIPCPALIHLRDRFYHSNEDSVDKVSSRTLQIAGGAMTAYLYAAAALDSDLAPEVAELCVAHAARRLHQAAEKGALTRRQRDYLVGVEQARLRSIERFSGADLGEKRRKIRALAGRLKVSPEKREAIPARVVREARRLVPVRTAMGPLTFQHIDPAKRAGMKFLPMWSQRLNLPLFWVDGKRTLLEIYEKSRCEFAVPLQMQDLLEYFRLLHREGLLRLRRL